MSAESVQQADQIERAALLLHRSRYAIALTGAGLSKESGVPTYRGEGGLWTRDGEPPMNGFQIFMQNPGRWWEQRLAADLEISNELAVAITAAAPNAGHTALVELERDGYLRTVITQNIDNLHRRAGSERLLEIHGNRTMLRCIGCEARFSAGQVPTDALPPHCDRCGGIIKSDTVMFGEPIPRQTLDACYEAASRADCMIVVGTSALVTPAADLPLIVRRTGGVLIEVNTDTTGLSRYCAATVRGPSGHLLPLLVEAVNRQEQSAPAERGSGVRA